MCPSLKDKSNLSIKESASWVSVFLVWVFFLNTIQMEEPESRHTTKNKTLFLHNATTSH